MIIITLSTNIVINSQVQYKLLKTAKLVNMAIKSLIATALIVSVDIAIGTSFEELYFNSCRPCEFDEDCTFDTPSTSNAFWQCSKPQNTSNIGLCVVDSCWSNQDCLEPDEWCFTINCCNEDNIFIDPDGALGLYSTMCLPKDYCSYESYLERNLLKEHNICYRGTNQRVYLSPQYPNICEEVCAEGMVECDSGKDIIPLEEEESDTIPSTSTVISVTPERDYANDVAVRDRNYIEYLAGILAVTILCLCLFGVFLFGHHRKRKDGYEMVNV